MSDYTVLPFTPKTRMIWRALLRKAVAWYEDEAAAYGVEPSVMDSAISDYAMISARVDGLNGAVDFKLTKADDTPEAMRKKFTQYMNSNSYQVIAAIEAQIRSMDTPTDSDKAPVKNADDLPGEV